MPIGRLIPDQDLQAGPLRDRLIQEWEAPGQAAQPILIESPGDRMSGSRHLLVIWDEWGSLDQRERSEIIMDAYEETHTRQEILSVTVAMGLTAVEAERMGIRYATEVVATEAVA